MNSRHLLVLCSCPDETTARRLAHEIVESKAAACVNIVPGLNSIYIWKDKLEDTKELLLFIKTTSAAFKTLEKIILNLHPYQCPEIIGLPIETGNGGYLEWLEQNVLPEVS